MGCGGSKATDQKTEPVPNGGANAPANGSPSTPNQNRVTLNQNHHERIGAIANTILGNSAQFHMVVASLIPLGRHADAAEMMRDRRELRQLFPKGQVPSQLEAVASSGASVQSIFNNMVQQCQSDCCAALENEMANTAGGFTEKEKAAFHQLVGNEAANAMQQMTNQYISETMRSQQPQVPPPRERSNPHGYDERSSVPPSGPPQNYEGSGSNINNNNNNNQQYGGGDDEHQPPVVLPAGKWVLAEGSPFYWSDDEKLFYHPESAQFFDPETNKWYDPERDEWYAEDDE